MAASQKTKTEIPKLFPTKTHKHPLELKHYIKPYTCDGCKEKGFGPRYRCEKCDFDLHKHCMFPHMISPISHEFFPNSIFNFHTTPPKACHDYCKRQCDACRKPINGFVYHSKKHGLDLHPCCRNLKTKYKIKGGEEEEDQMEFTLHKKVQQKCLWCNKRSIKEGDHSNGWSYISKCKKFHFHVACVTEMFLEEWNNKRDTIHKINYNVNKLGRSSDTTLALQKVDFKEIQARRNGNGKSGNKFWRILKIFLKTIVSVVLGDPTMALASLLVELLA